MGSPLAILTLVIATLVTLAVAVPSPVPVCTFECPPIDLAGRPLGPHSNSNSELFCRFQSVPNDFFCKYFLSTGLLKQDHDQGFCPPVAIPICNFRKKRAALPRAPAPPSPAARSTKPQVMKTRGRLGKMKRNE